MTDILRERHRLRNEDPDDFQNSRHDRGDEHLRHASQKPPSKLHPAIVHASDPLPPRRRRRDHERHARLRHRIAPARSASAWPSAPAAPAFSSSSSSKQFDSPRRRNHRHHPRPRRLPHRSLETPLTTAISIPAIDHASVIVSASVGILFGFYPAWKASRLGPIKGVAARINPKSETRNPKQTPNAQRR